MPKRTLISLICGLALAAWTPPAAAEDWYVTPWIDAWMEYNSNVFYTSTREVDDFIFKVRPGFSAFYGTERTEWTCDAAFEGQLYMEDSDLNTVEITSSAAVARQWTDRFSTRLGFIFIRDETLDSDLREAGVRAVRDTRYRYGPEFTFAYLVTDRFGLEGGAGYHHTDYDSDYYVDRDTWAATLRPYYMVTPRDRVGLSFGIAYTDYDDTSRITTFTNALFWRHDITEATYFVLSAGYRYTDAVQESSSVRRVIDPTTGEIIRIPVRDRYTSTDGGFIFGIDLVHQLSETLTLHLKAGREVYNSSLANTYERTYVRGRLDWKLAEHTKAALSAGYDYNDQISGVGDETTHYIRVSPTLTHRLRENLYVQAGFSLEHSIEDYGRYDDDIDRYRAWAGLHYAWDHAWRK